jgi:peptidoglycan/LPS O-acetylase OafA/YrhL
MSTATAVVTIGRSTRVIGLDFVKGSLVVLMVLYHWLNYFVAIQGYVYRYLRFITPSFIFISGFIISFNYLRSDVTAEAGAAKRLAKRGAKLFALFAVLNVGVAALSGSHGTINILSRIWISLAQSSIAAIEGYQGVKVASFYILVPIGYELLLSAVLLSVSEWSMRRRVFGSASLALLVVTLVLDISGHQQPTLEMVTIGMLGVVAGFTPIAEVEKIAGHPLLVTGCYLCYLVSVTIWNVIYPLQIVGVVLSLAGLYLIGESGMIAGWTHHHAVFLGRYSLLGYIAQIAILQALLRVAAKFGMQLAISLLMLPVAIVLTSAVIAGTDVLRRRSAIADRIYRTVFV